MDYAPNGMRHQALKTDLWEMTADTPAGYAAWWGMNELRKLAKKIGDDKCTQGQ